MKMYAELKLKQCVVCKETKTENLFYKDKRRSMGLARECKVCKKKEEHLSRKNDPERWYKKRHRSLLSEKYGITIHDYNRMFDKQNGCCLICQRHQTILKKRLFVDHDHQSNEIRGLLCQRCNFAIGLLDESMEIFMRALDYINKFKK
jgi:hypothetical protein